MELVLLVIQTIVALLLIASVLVQRSDSDGMGLSGGGGGNGLLSSRGKATFMTRTTAVLAFVFMANSLLLGVITARSTSMSLVDDVVAEQPISAPKDGADQQKPSAPKDGTDEGKPEASEDLKKAPASEDKPSKEKEKAPSELPEPSQTTEEKQNLTKPAPAPEATPLSKDVGADVVPVEAPKAQ